MLLTDILTDVLNERTDLLVGDQRKNRALQGSD
jgi:hypothetical protein